MYTIVLAGTIREAAEHAKKHGLPRGRWRYAVKASTVRGLRVAEIHVLPGFHKRLDRHSILAALRYTKGERIEFGPRDEPIVDYGLVILEEEADAADEPVLEEAAPDVPVKRKRRAPKPVSNTLETTPMSREATQLETGGFF